MLRPVTNIVECNTVESVKNSSNKLLMKNCFTREGVKTALWWTTSNGEGFNQSSTQPTVNVETLPFPIVAKHIYGSRGTGNTLLNTLEEYRTFIPGKTLSNYIFEKFYNFSREYRLHVDREECFYTCRKMLKNDVAPENRWYRNDSNSVWILEDNESFDKPVNWDNIVSESIKALTSVGLDVGAIDVRVQSSSNSRGSRREEPEFIILETNSAPSFGEITAQKYLQQLPKILRRKYANQ